MKYFYLTSIFILGVTLGFYLNDIYFINQLKEGLDFNFIKEVQNAKRRKIEVYISSDKQKIIVFSADIQHQKICGFSTQQGIYDIKLMDSLNIIKTKDWYKFQLNDGHLGQIGKKIIKNEEN